MFHTEKAFKFACKNGYAQWDDSLDQCFVKTINGGHFLTKEQVLLDTEFWRSLRWLGDGTVEFARKLAHDFIDHIFAGNSPDDFFQKIMNV